MRQLLWSDINLDGAEPCIDLRPETTKNKEGGRIPLVPALATLLREKKALGMHVSGRVFATGLPRVETLAKDLAACGIRVEDERGFRVDFHALRYTFISLLTEADVSDVVRRTLARHGSLKMTDRYTDAKSVPLANGISKLASSLPSSLASLKTGKTCPKQGNGVHPDNATNAPEIVNLARVVHSWEKENWRREGDSNPRYGFTRTTV